MLLFALASTTAWADWWRFAHHKGHAAEAHHAVVAALRAENTELQRQLAEVQDKLQDCQESGLPAMIEGRKSPPSPSPPPPSPDSAAPYHSQIFGMPCGLAAAHSSCVVCSVHQVLSIAIDPSPVSSFAQLVTLCGFLQSQPG